MKDTLFHVESTEGPTAVEILPVVSLQYVYICFLLRARIMKEFCAFFLYVLFIFFTNFRFDSLKRNPIY